MLRKSTFILLIILLVLALAVIFIQRAPGLNSTTDQLPTSTDSPTLMNLAGKSITAFTMSDDQGRVVKAKLDNQGTWFIQNPSDCQYDSDQLAYYLSLVQTFKVQVSLDVPPALADIGLITPTYQLVLTFNDGSTQKLSVGSLVPTGTGYYVQVNNDSVVVVSNISIDQLFGIVSTFCATPTPEPSATPEPTLTQTEAVPEASVTPAQ
jgi:hypothetical protein